MADHNRKILKQTYQGVAQTMSKGQYAPSFFPSPKFDDYHLTRGLMDLRGQTLSIFDDNAMAKMMPQDTAKQIGWICALDAYALMALPNLDHMPGAKRNINHFVDHLFSGDYRSPDEYDRDAFIVTIDFLKNICPDRQWVLDVTDRYNDNQLGRAQTRHYFFHQRLKKNANVIRMVIEDENDPQSLAHMLASAMGDEPKPEDLNDLLQKFMDELNQDGLPIPPELIEFIETEQTLENTSALQNLFVKSKEFYEDRILSEHFDSKRYIQLDDLNRRTREKIAKQIKRDPDGKYQKKIEGWKKQIKQREKEQKSLRPIGGEAFIKVRDLIQKYRQKNPQKITITTTKTHTVKSQNIDDLYIEYGQDLKKANRIGRQMAQFIMSPRSTVIERQLPEGVLDTSSLSGIVTNPFGKAAEKPYYRRHEKFGSQLDTAVTLLVDRSGSMNGEKIAMAYIAAERLAYWLSYAGIQIEVLGYTNDNYTVYKPFQETIRPQQSKDTMSGLLSGDMNLTPTGECTIWAHDRLLLQPNQRKILMVLTDGRSNGKIEVADVNQWIEQKSPIELAGVGIMHDVSENYKRHIYVEKPSDLMTSVASQLRAMMDKPMESHGRIARRLEPAAKVFNLKMIPERHHKRPTLTK